MKKTTLISLILILIPLSLWSQDNLWENREDIILEYENYPDTNFQYIIIDSTDKITVKIYGYDSLEINHYIRPNQNGKFDNQSLCDSIVINLLCDSCIEFHLIQMSTSKERKWIKHSDILYISSRYVSKFWPADKTSIIYTVPIMKIIKGEQHTQIILFTEALTKKQWKELKNNVNYKKAEQP